MKKLLALMFVIISILTNVHGATAEAKSEYMSEEDARYFLAFIYNAGADHVTREALADDIYYKMLTGGYSNDPTYELAAKAAFLSHMDARIIDTLEKANVAVNTSRDYLLEYFSDNIDEDATGLVTKIYRENVEKSIFELCGGEEVLGLVGTITDVVENPDKYLDDVKAISSAFAYAYGQNVASLYTYFDVALSNVYLKSTEGAYEIAMAYTVMALKDSNFMSFAAKLIPGISSWEEWIDKMDYWAEFAYNMKGEVVADNSSDFKLVVYHPNCDDLKNKVLWYTGGQLYAPEMEREGYILRGWYFDEKCTIGPVTNDYVPIEDVVYLYAKWEPRYYTITFKSSCDEVQDYTYELDRLNVNWYEPVMNRDGYIFNGWYWDSACEKPVEGEFEVTGNMTFYAGWVCQYRYTISNKKATIYDVAHWKKDENGNDITDLVIPEKVGGCPVAAVEFDFYSKAISGITFPKSVTTVKEWSFTWFTELKKVILNDGITVIEEGAFARSSKIETVSFGKNLKTIGYEAFTSCGALTEIDLPEGLVSIDSYAFSNCGISELDLPDSVTMVGNGAFSGCENLKNVTIGKGLADISETIFEGCDALECITVSADNPKYTTVDGVLYSKDMTVLYKYPAAKAGTSFKLPGTVTKIAAYAFEGCNVLESIDISKVKIIENEAFSNFKSLKTIDISDITCLGEEAFCGCGGLKSVDIPTALEGLNRGTFSECTALETVVIPNNIKFIGDDCFSGCSAITSISIPESVTEIGEFAFSGCTNLKSIELPSQIKSITPGMFNYCISLEEIEIPQNAACIEYCAFNGCRKLKTIDIPKNVTEIQFQAFSNCSGLEKIVIPDGVSYIFNDTFYGCDSLKKIVLPASINGIDSYNFETTSTLTEVYFKGTKDEWASVYIDSYGNDYLSNAEIICDVKVVAEFANLKSEKGEICGEIVYDCITEDTDVLVALFCGENFEKIAKLKAKSGDEKTELLIEGEENKSYDIKAFFWDFSTLRPKGKCIETK